MFLELKTNSNRVRNADQDLFFLLFGDYIDLFSLFTNATKVDKQDRNSCNIIYTFVMGM